MAIRITGMYSGLDTESIISELVSAQSVKKDKLVKAQTKLSWKQDAWKALNTKIYSFYTNVLDNMRWQASYMKKATKVSNSNAVSVVTSSDAPNSVQSMKISQLAKTGYLTSATVTADSGKQVTDNTTLKDLDPNFSGAGSFRVQVGNKAVDISVNENTKISEVVSKLQSAGIEASFDQKNQRFYLNSKNSGAAADFTITSNDGNGQKALAALGLVSAYDVNSKEYQEYSKWAAYSLDFDQPDAARDAAMKAEIDKLIASKKEDSDSRAKSNEDLHKRIDALLKDNEENSKYDISRYEVDGIAYGYDPDLSDKENAEALMNWLYGPEHEVQATTEVQKKDENGELMFDEDGKPIMETVGQVDNDGNPIMVKVRDGGLKKTMDDQEQALKDAQNELKEQQDILAEQKKNGAPADDISMTEALIASKSEAVSNAQRTYNSTKGVFSFAQAVSDAENAIVANDEAIAANQEYYQVDTNGDPVLDENKKLQATATAEQEIQDYFKEKITAAQQYKQEADAKIAEMAGKTPEEQEAIKSQYATKVEGQDAEIVLNGVKYTNKTNTFEINGLTITAQQETDEAITLTTSEDTDGIYDMIKNFFTEYNKLINEMDALYNADSSKGYEPLLSEEKSGLSDSEIEEWEKKIKDSLLRRDGTLGDVTNTIKTIMLQGATVNGKTMYLSDFGINTLGYFNAADNEKGAYHINGDKDDANVSNADDVLRQMIASDPDTVMKFFSSLANNLHDELNEKMKSVKDTSSAFTVYNDKLLQKEYDDYKDKIKKEETKLNDLMDKWYAKFSAMETAMAKLQSKNNAVSGMFGGN